MSAPGIKHGILGQAAHVIEETLLQIFSDVPKAALTLLSRNFQIAKIESAEALVSIGK